MKKNIVEVFSAGCPLCVEAAEEVRRVAPADALRIHDMHSVEGRTRAAEVGVARVPAISVDGRLVDCCQIGPVRPDRVRDRLA